jgi:hypothetical protein
VTSIEKGALAMALKILKEARSDHWKPVWTERDIEWARKTLRVFQLAAASQKGGAG